MKRILTLSIIFLLLSVSVSQAEYLGRFTAGASVFYAANFHNDTGTIEDPSAPEAQIRNPAGTWSALSAPAKQNSKTGFYGGTVDTTGYASGEYTIRMAGTVTTAKTVATTFTFMVGPAAVNVTQWDGTAATDMIATINEVTAAVRQDMDANSTKLSLLDASVTSRLASGTVIEGSYTLQQFLRLMAAQLFGKITGGGTAEVCFRDMADTKNRICMTLDANKNRTAVTKDPN